MRYVRLTATVVILMLSVTACASRAVGRTVGFTEPANACALLSPDEIARAGGPGGLTAEKDPDPHTAMCRYRRDGRDHAFVYVMTETADGPGTARDFLDTAMRFGGVRESVEVPGLGGAASFASRTGTAGILVGAVWVAQVRGTSILIEWVGMDDPSGAQAPVVALARTVLGRL